MSIMTNKNIIPFLRTNKDLLTGTQLLDIADECRILFHEKIMNEKGSNVTGRDIKRCTVIFTYYHLAINS